MNEREKVQSADNDLWEFVIPEQRSSATGKQAVAEWREAVRFMYGVVAMVEETGAKPATKQVAHDARERAGEALRRAEGRLGEAQAQSAS